MGEAYPMRQTGFQGGQIGGELLGRTDQSKYASGMALIRNFTVTRFGGMENRSGSLYCTATKVAANTVQTIPFVFNYANSYLLEVGAGYIRITQDGVPISIVGSPAFSQGTYWPAGSVVSYGGSYYYKTDEHKNTTSTTLTISGGPPWTIGSTVTLTASAALFGGSYVGTTMVVFDGNGNSCVMLVGSVTGSLIATCTLVTACPVSLQGVATTDWAANNAFPAVGPPWYLEPSNVLEIPASTITQAAIGSITHAEENDVMILASQQFLPLQLTRYSSQRWVLATYVETTGIQPPTNVAVSNPSEPGNIPSAVGAVGGDVTLQPPDQYAVAYYNSHLTISQTSAVAIATVGQADSANPVVVSWTNNAGSAAQGFYVYKLNHSTGQFGLVANVAGGITTTWTDTGITPSSNPSPLGNNTGQFTYVITAIDAVTGAESFASVAGTITSLFPDDSYPNVITWSPAYGTNGQLAAKYNIYEIYAGIPGLIGTALTPTFTDVGYTPNTAIQPPVSILVGGLFNTPDDYPAVVYSFQQRFFFANTLNQPQTWWATQEGSTNNFTIHTPLLDTDAIQATIAGDQTQPIQALVDLGKLIIHTGNGEYVCQGNAEGDITPTSSSAIRQGSCGSAFIPPVVIGNTDVFVQARGQFTRDLRYEIQAFMYVGKDLSVFDPDLFKGRTIVTMAWQQVKNSQIWMAMSDGTLVTLTYIRETVEQGMWAWHVHDMQNGFVEWVSVVPEDVEDVVYVVVRRTIQGSVVRYIERLANREFLDTQNLTDAVFVDSAQIFDGRNTGSQTMVLTAQTAGQWGRTNLFNLLTSPATIFVDGDVGKTIVLQQLANGTQVNPLTLAPYPVGWVIAQFSVLLQSLTTSLEMVVSVYDDVPAWAQGQPTTTWGWAATVFSGMQHLAGQTVSILGDGNVIANPQRTDLPLITLDSGGGFTSPVPLLVCIAGLPIMGLVQTLPPENQKGPTIIGKKKTVKELVGTFYQTRGLRYGMCISDLIRWKQRQSENWNAPTRLFTGSVRLTGVPNTWDYNAQVYLQQLDPLPATILALIADVDVGN